MLVGKSILHLSDEHQYKDIKKVLQKHAQGISPTPQEYGAFKLARVNFLEKLHTNIPQLAAPQEGTLWFVVKKLLTIDPAKRWSAEEALRAECFADLNLEEQHALFNALFTKFQESHAKEAPSHHADMFSKKGSASTRFTHDTEMELPSPRKQKYSSAGEQQALLHYAHIPLYSARDTESTLFTRSGEREAFAAAALPIDSYEPTYENFPENDTDDDFVPTYENFPLPGNGEEDSFVPVYETFPDPPRRAHQ